MCLRKKILLKQGYPLVRIKEDLDDAFEEALKIPRFKKYGRKGLRRIHNRVIARAKKEGGLIVI